MNLNTFLLFDGALVLLGLPILMISKIIKSNFDFTLQGARNNVIPQKIQPKYENKIVSRQLFWQGA